MNMNTLIRQIREIHKTPTGPLALHAPVFHGNEAHYVQETIESTFVSSVGKYVERFESLLQNLTGAASVVACVNGTAALEMALRLAGVQSGDLVLTQSLSFVATANAIVHTGAQPVFLDIERSTLGLSPDAVEAFLTKECEIVSSDSCRHKVTGQRIAACCPMHSFGFPCRIQELLEICRHWNIPVVEDAAEALGSLRNGQHCGTFGKIGVLSFNGNKICTTGGGGAILTQNQALGHLAKHLTTTAKIPHPWEYRHDAPAWNLRLPNLNAALGCGQLECLENFVHHKRAIAKNYAALFTNTDWEFVSEPEQCRSNYWLCAVLTNNRSERDALLTSTNKAGVMTRPCWEPLHTLSMYTKSLHDTLNVTMYITERLVNLPSGVSYE